LRLSLFQGIDGSRQRRMTQADQTRIVLLQGAVRADTQQTDIRAARQGEDILERRQTAPGASQLRRRYPAGHRQAVAALLVELKQQRTEGTPVHLVGKKTINESREVRFQTLLDVGDRRNIPCGNLL